MGTIYGQPTPETEMTEAQRRVMGMANLLIRSAPPLPPASAGVAAIVFSDYEIPEFELKDVKGLGILFLGARNPLEVLSWLDFHDSIAAEMFRTLDTRDGELPLVVVTEGATLVAGISGGDRKPAVRN